MTAPVALPETQFVQTIPEQEIPVNLSARPTTAWLWLSSLFMLFFPWRIGRGWVGASLKQSIIVALLNSASIGLWIFVVLVCAARAPAPRAVANPRTTGSIMLSRPATFPEARAEVINQIGKNWWQSLRVTDKL